MQSHSNTCVAYILNKVLNCRPLSFFSSVLGAAVGGAANVVGSALSSVANLTQTVTNAAAVIGAAVSQSTGRKMLMQKES